MDDKEARKMIEDLKPRQLRGERLPCPRCGLGRMDGRPIRNALSRHADVYVCDACGMEEALLDASGSRLPLAEWACVRPPLPTEIVIVVEGGLVRDVYAPAGVNISVEVVDIDSDVPDSQDEADARMAEIKDDVRRGIRHAVY